MDRSFLSKPEVIAAARDFVCVRLTTYENEDENRFLKSFKVTRTGEVENTTTAILAPDGKERLTRAARGLRQVFGDAASMAETLTRIGRQYEAKTNDPPPELPAVATVRLALDVAACDLQPLVVLFAPDATARRGLEADLVALAWSEEFRGRFTYAVTTEAKDLAALGVKSGPGVVVIEPDQFGVKGTLLAQSGVTATREALAKILKEALARLHADEKTFQNHVRAGRQAGVFWETKRPVTDLQEKQARERGRKPYPFVYVSRETRET